MAAAALEMLGVLVPAEHIAKVIGKQGTGLKQIREATGVKVQVHQTEVNPAPEVGSVRRVDLIGQSEQLVSAFQLLLNKAFLDDAAMPILYIPASRAGQVVGRGGENLKKVREECRVRLNLERDHVLDPSTGLQERVLTMQGEVTQMARALRYMLGVTVPSARKPLGLPLISADPDEVQLHLAVPERLAGAILGKGGQAMKQTAAQAGCKVTMTSRDQGSERRAVMVGTFSQCMSAQTMLYEQLAEAARAAGQEISELTVLFLVRSEAAGAVIGRAGATLKQIREASGVNIQLAREEIEGQRPCTLTGSIENVMQAEQSIVELIRQVPVAYAGLTLPAAPFPEGPSFAEPTAKRQRTDDGELTTKLLVPAQSAGAIIGKQGSGLREIRETTGAHVDMLQQAQAPCWPHDRVVILRGRPAARQAATLAVLRMAFPPSNEQCSLKLLVTDHQAGIVIGKQGNTLKYLREQCGVRVEVEREEIFGARLVTALGSHAVVSAAAVHICNMLDNQAALQLEATNPSPALSGYEGYGLPKLPGLPTLPTPGAYA